MVSYDWHSDGNNPEKGGADGVLTRTIIVCFDSGYVNFQVAGYRPTLYDEILAPSFLCMPPDVYHRSKHTNEFPPRALDPSRALCQRKLVIHMGPANSQEHPVDWTQLCSAEEQQYLAAVAL